MAYCSNCGLDISADSRFCSGCGMRTLPATMAAPFTSPVRPSEAALSSAALPQRQSVGKSSLMKILLVAAAGFVVLCMILFAVLVHFANDAQDEIRARGDQASNIVMPTIDGWRAQQGLPQQENTESITKHYSQEVPTPVARDLALRIGVDLYPGAIQDHISDVRHPGSTASAIVLWTSDSVDAVAEFYKSRYSSATFRSEGPNVFSLTSNPERGNGPLIITAERFARDTRISISKVAMNEKVRPSK